MRIITIGHSREWLLAAAQRLEGEGQLELAAQARTEADNVTTVDLDAPTRPAAVRCDLCGTAVRGAARLDRYSSVDWALCARCERAESPAVAR